MHPLILLLLLCCLVWAREYTNPILPGWHSDPSCITIPYHFPNTTTTHHPHHPDSTYKSPELTLCTTSSFLTFPGLPIYASADLVHWELASNAFNRETQIPDLRDVDWTTTSGGNFAATIRYHGGVFYVIVTFFGGASGQGVSLQGLVFMSRDLFNERAWSEPARFPVLGIDPDIFFDDDGEIYVTVTDSQHILHHTLNLSTGTTGPITPLWNGTGLQNPEGPHLYKISGYYYLLLAEGGTELGHAATIARSRNRTGPWEVNPNNPVLTSRNTTRFFQTVGHADLFVDKEGRWWAVALATRSGVQWRDYPMGRETVLSPVKWVDGWPVAGVVGGFMRGALPVSHPDVSGERGKGYVGDPDEVDFNPGSRIPGHFVHWRFPPRHAFKVSPADSGHPHALVLTPSVYNLTGNASMGDEDGITFVGRRQMDTLFTYSVDMAFSPGTVHEEAGVTLFLTPAQHIDLGIILLQSLSSSSSNEMELGLRFRVQGRGNHKGPLPPARTIPVSKNWTQPIKLQIQAANATNYVFSASNLANNQSVVFGHAPSTILSGGTGPYVGALVGTYATSNGAPEPGSGNKAFVSRWRYYGQGQEVDYGVLV